MVTAVIDLLTLAKSNNVTGRTGSRSSTLAHPYPRATSSLPLCVMATAAPGTSCRARICFMRPSRRSSCSPPGRISPVTGISGSGCAAARDTPTSEIDAIKQTTRIPIRSVYSFSMVCPPFPAACGLRSINAKGFEWPQMNADGRESQRRQFLSADWTLMAANFLCQQISSFAHHLRPSAFSG